MHKKRIAALGLAALALAGMAPRQVDAATDIGTPVVPCRVSWHGTTWSPAQCPSHGITIQTADEHQTNGDDIQLYDTCRATSRGVVSTYSDGSVVCVVGSPTDAVVPVIGEPAEVAACRDGITRWRIYGHLVVAMETCELNEDLGRGDTLVLLMDDGGNPADRCDDHGGRWEFIGRADGFHLGVCWAVDY